MKPISLMVGFEDADGENIVFFGNYPRLAHRALEQFMPAIGIPWHEWFANKEWAAPFRKMECEFMKPLRPGEHFTVDITVKAMSNSTVTFDYLFKNEKGEETTRFQSVNVFIDRKVVKKRDIPEHVRKILAKYQV